MGPSDLFEGVNFFYKLEKRLDRITWWIRRRCKFCGASLPRISGATRGEVEADCPACGKTQVWKGKLPGWQVVAGLVVFGVVLFVAWPVVVMLLMAVVLFAALFGTLKLIEVLINKVRRAKKAEPTTDPLATPTGASPPVDMPTDDVDGVATM